VRRNLTSRDRNRKDTRSRAGGGGAGRERRSKTAEAHAAEFFLGEGVIVTADSVTDYAAADAYIVSTPAAVDTGPLRAGARM
jgi:hypothetical protein